MHYDSCENLCVHEWLFAKASEIEPNISELVQSIPLYNSNNI